MRISDWSSDVCSSDLHGSNNQVAQFIDRFIFAGQPHQNILVLGFYTTRWKIQVGGQDGLLHLQDGHAVSFQLGCIDANLDFPLLPADRSEEHTSELQSLMRISYAVFCLKKNKKPIPNVSEHQ